MSSGPFAVYATAPRPCTTCRQRFVPSQVSGSTRGALNNICQRCTKVEKEAKKHKKEGKKS